MTVHQNSKTVRSGQDLETADKVVIMLHGRSATAESILHLSEQLPEAAYLAPQAAKRQWYPRSFMESREKNQPHLDSALELVDSLVQEAADSVGRENVYLLGFSQGACLASEYVASHPGRYGGLIVLSGGLIGDQIQEYEGNFKETPVFIGCSDNDPHIPLERVNETVEVLKNLNGDVEKYIMQGSHHGIGEYEIEKIKEMLK